VVAEGGEALPTTVLTVRVSATGGDRRHAPADADWTGTFAVDASGTRALTGVPCGAVFVQADADGYAPGVRGVRTAAGEPPAVVEIPLSIGVRVYGTVSDAAGQPLAGVELSVGGSDTTSDSDGDYTLRTDTAARTLHAEAFGYAQVWRPLGDPDATGDFRVDVTLEPVHELRVWCAGMPDDDCGDIPMQCTAPLMPLGGDCGHDEALGETRCTCPDGDVAVRGGGRSVRVAASATEAWLDFRDTGALTGRVLRDGEPAAACQVTAIRVPEALEDLPRGLVVGRDGACDADGRFRLEGLVVGDWELVAHVADAGDTPLERTLVPHHLASGEEHDLGDIAIEGGGGIAGVLVDGLTGEPKAHAPVLAYRSGARDERITPTGTDTDADGHFSFDGLPPGSWTVAHPLSPQEAVHVVVRDGAVTSGVKLVTSDATALDVNGFELADDDGALVVTDVTPDSPADDAGLEPGDAVVGVRIAGFDLPEALGERKQALTRLVLGHWDGPGVTLVVDRDGDRQEVPLDW
jgi:hypothetical protein